jgi:hypothetical protein
MSSTRDYARDIEVTGTSLNSLLDAVSDLSTIFEERTRETLADHGIEDVADGEWYSLSAYLDALAEIGDEIGSQTLTNVGKAIPDNADWPPGIDSVEAGLGSIDDAYQMNHRGGEFGFYEYEQVADGEALVTCENPYPCDFDRGLLAGVAEKFGPEGTIVEVEEESDTCRSDGGERCVYRVLW